MANCIFYFWRPLRLSYFLSLVILLLSNSAFPAGYHVTCSGLDVVTVSSYNNPNGDFDPYSKPLPKVTCSPFDFNFSPNSSGFSQQLIDLFESGDSTAYVTTLAQSIGHELYKHHMTVSYPDHSFSAAHLIFPDEPDTIFYSNFSSYDVNYIMLNSDSLDLTVTITVRVFSNSSVGKPLTDSVYADYSYSMSVNINASSLYNSCSTVSLSSIKNSSSPLAVKNNNNAFFGQSPFYYLIPNSPNTLDSACVVDLTDLAGFNFTNDQQPDGYSKCFNSGTYSAKPLPYYYASSKFHLTDLTPNSLSPDIFTSCTSSDSDNDGVPDNLDQCPNTDPNINPNFVNNINSVGCFVSPDSDGDGVNDFDASGLPLDKCPNSSNPNSSDGCPPVGSSLVYPTTLTNGSSAFKFVLDLSSVLTPPVGFSVSWANQGVMPYFEKGTYDTEYSIKTNNSVPDYVIVKPNTITLSDLLKNQVSDSSLDSFLTSSFSGLPLPSSGGIKDYQTNKITKNITDVGLCRSVPVIFNQKTFNVVNDLNNSSSAGFNLVRENPDSVSLNKYANPSQFQLNGLPVFSAPNKKLFNDSQCASDLELKNCIANSTINTDSSTGQQIVTCTGSGSGSGSGSGDQLPAGSGKTYSSFSSYSGLNVSNSDLYKNNVDRLNSSFGTLPVSSPHSCPKYSIDLSPIISKTFNIESHCDIFAQYSSLLSLLFHALWLFIGFRIFMSA